jgi:single-strand DNA-binding protein
MAQLTGLFTLGRDAETRVTQNGTTVITLAVAYNYGRKGEDGKKPSQWVRASMFGKQAETLAPYLTKGKQVSLVIRDLHIATFQKKQDGSTGTSLEGVADFDDFARGQKQEGAAPAPAPRPAPPPPPAQRSAGSGFDDMGDDGIPFRDPMSYRGAHLVL